MRAPRDEAELDDQIIQRSLAHGPAAAAAYCREVLDSGSWPADVSRALLLVHVGEYSAMAGDQAAAETAFREAVADAGRARPDARCYLAGWCLEHGTPDEGQRLIDDIWRERPTDPDVYLYLGELHEERDDLAGATRWFTAGAMRTMRSDRLTIHHAILLLIARRRVRLAQGFTEDDYDSMAGEMQADMAGR